MENAYANNRELPEKENLSVLTSLDSVSVMMPWLQVMTKTNKNSCLNKKNLLVHLTSESKHLFGLGIVGLGFQ